MAYDSVRPLGLESPAEGGSELRLTPIEIDPLHDGLTAAAVFLNGSAVTAADKAVYVDRTAAGLRLSDPQATQTLSNIVGSGLTGSNPHQALLDMAHFVGAPADGWPSGCTRSVTMTGPLVTVDAWYSTSAMTQLIFKRSFTYLGPLVSTITNQIYNATGSAVVRQMVQTFGYNGPLTVSETRTWS